MSGIADTVAGTLLLKTVYYHSPTRLSAMSLSYMPKVPKAYWVSMVMS